MTRIIFSLKKDRLREVFTLTISKERFEEFVRIVSAGAKAQNAEAIVEVEEDFL